MNGLSQLIRNHLNKLLIPVVLLSGLCIVYMNVYLQQATRDSTVGSTVASAKATADHFKILRKYYTENVVAKAGAAGLTPRADHKSDPRAIPLPATMIHDLSGLIHASDSQVQLRLFSEYPFPGRRDRVLDPTQREALKYLEANPDSTFVKTEQTDAGEVVRVAIADRMAAAACVGCHNAHPDSPKRDWKLGEVRGVLEIVTPVTAQMAANAAIRQQVLILTVTALILMALIGVGLLALLRSTHRRTGELLEVVSAAARGDFSREVTVQGEDDLGRMGAGLQQMVDALRSKSQDMLDVVRHAAQGDLTRQVHVSGQDPMGQIGEGLAHLFADLRSSISAIARSASTLAAESREMNGVSVALNGTATRASQQAGQAAAASTQVNQNLQSMAVATEEVSASIREISVGASDAARIASQAVSLASTTREWMNRLDARSQEIGQVLTAITRVAEQTHLLALNATIEAARAGEAGKGFAVVANEVKELATATAHATEDIRTKIEAIQKDTRGAASSIAEIHSIIHRISDIQTTIASAVEEQTATSSEIARHVSQAAQGCADSSRHSLEVAEVSRSTAGRAGDIQRAADALSSMADQLHSLVQRFRYEEESAEPAQSEATWWRQAG